MRLLVTGGAGFIGSNLIRHIIGRSEIERLINLDCLTYAGSPENLRGVADHAKYIFEKEDLRDRPAVRSVFQKHDVTHVLHLAAESHVDRSISAPDDFIQTNIIGTFNLLECARAAWMAAPTGKRFHHVSTDEVYGSLGSTGYFTETSPYAPNSPYSASKASSDLLVRAAYHTYGLPVVTTNCSNNYGPFQFPEKLIPVVIQNAISRRPIPLYGDGLHVRDWLHVCDHAEALWQVLTRGRVGEVYNIGGKNEWTNRSVAELICDIVDEVTPKPGACSRKLITFVNDRPGHDRRYAIDITKIQGELGWSPTQDFQAGIRETVRWYLENQEWVERAKSRTPLGKKPPANQMSP